MILRRCGGARGAGRGVGVRSKGLDTILHLAQYDTASLQFRHWPSVPSQQLKIIQHLQRKHTSPLHGRGVEICEQSEWYFQGEKFTLRFPIRKKIFPSWMQDFLCWQIQLLSPHFLLLRNICCYQNYFITAKLCYGILWKLVSLFRHVHMYLTEWIPF